MKKIMSSMLVIILVLTMIIPVNMIKAEAAMDYDVERYGDVLDIGRFLRANEKDEAYRAKLDNEIEEMASKLSFDSEEDATDSNDEANLTSVGITKEFLGYDNGRYYFKEYTLKSLGDNVEVWVANDLSFYALDDEGNDMPDPYNREPYIITQEQADKMKNIFDGIVYPTDTEFFGMPDSHQGDNALLGAWGLVPEGYYTPEDGVERVIILVDNVRDEQYYDPEYPFFIAGFYSPSYEVYFDRNVISLDAKDWETRLESTFKGTAAHEFQHLIHDDNDTDEENWINEGMSDYAEYLCFNEHAWRHVNFFLDHPENSLVEWDEHYSAETGPETLADYGQAYLMQLYINEQFGKEFVRDLAKSELNGIESVNALFDEKGIDLDFEELFRRFTIALAIDSPEPGEGIYNFETIDLNINYESALLYDKDGVPAWGADYKEINHANKIDNITIDGVGFLPSPWKVVSDPLGSGEQVLWGNEGHLRDNMLILEADLSGVDTASLKFDNFIDIEDDWDAGIVQVSTDNGETWVSLANENTVAQEDFTYNDQVPQIYENMPGFTGYYDDWIKETFDLSVYAGQKILVNFRYMTDSAYNDTGWYIDNIEIPEINYYNDCSSTVAFKSIDEVKGIDVEYALTFINEKAFGKGNSKQEYSVLNIDPMNVTEADAIQLREFFSGGNNYMIVWYAAPVGKMGPVEFTYNITTKSEASKTKMKDKKN